MRVWILIVALALSLLWHATAPINPTQPCERLRDHAALLLDVERAANWEQLGGPYSRFGFRHPLPTYAYLYSWSQRILPAWPNRYAAIEYTQAAIGVAILAGCVLVLLGHGVATPLVLLFLACLFTALLFAHPAVFTDAWGPSTLLLPITLLILSAASWCAGNANALLPLLIAALLSLSNHIGVAPLLLVVSAFCFWFRPQRWPTCGVLIGSTTILLLALCPALLDLWRNGVSSNPWRIFEFIWRGGREREVLDLVGRAADAIGSWLPIAGLMLAAVALMLVRFSLPFFDRLRVLTVALIALQLIVTLQIRGRIYPYLLWNLLPIAAIAAFLLLFWLIPRMQTVLVVVLALLVPLLAMRYQPLGCESHGQYGEKVAALSIDQTKPVMVSASRSDWGHVPALLVELRQRGMRACTTERWGRLVGHDLVCDNATGPFQRIEVTSGNIELRRE